MEVCSSFGTCCSSTRIGKRHLLFHIQKTRTQRRTQLSVKFRSRNYTQPLPTRTPAFQSKMTTFSVKCSQDWVAESDTSEIMDNETVLLVRNAKEIISDLNGTCLFFIGMSSSIRTDVAKNISDALGYYFFDSDKLIEQASGGASAAWKLKEEDEEGYRNCESEVLRQLSSMGRLVVSTGDGVVGRLKNLQYMRNGITIWLDIPLEALAKKTVEEGLEVQGLLGQTTAGSHSQVLERLTRLFEERQKAYATSDVKVSVQKIAGKTSCEDVFALKPAVIATEVVRDIHKLLRYKKLQRAAAEPEIQRTFEA